MELGCVFISVNKTAKLELHNDVCLLWEIDTTECAYPFDRNIAQEKKASLCLT